MYLKVEFPCGYKVEAGSWHGHYEGQLFFTCPIHGEHCKKG